MPVPALTPAGYLPVGVHECTLREIESMFCSNEHRQALFQHLPQFLRWLADLHGLNMPCYIDGSFTTDKPNPGDIDVVLDLSGAVDGQIGAAIRLFADRQQIKNDFHIDYFPYFPGALNDLRSFFQYIRVEDLQRKQLPSDLRKGILRVLP